MRKRILVVDDDPALLDILQVILTEANYEAILVEHTDDLFSLVRSYQPSLVILDFRLEGRDGGDWCAKLKSHPEFSDIPVMIFTACSIAIQKGSYGCDDFLAKPFDIEDLLLHVNQLIGQQISNVYDRH